MQQTDIYGTLGPACQSQEIIRKMFSYGMTGMRLNLSHVGLEQCGELLEMFHRAAALEGVSPKLLIDLQGPELRVGEITSQKMDTGTVVLLGTGGIPVPPVIFENMTKGQQILLDDGKLLLKVEELEGLSEKEACARCRVLRGGLLKGRKSIALPGQQVYAPTLTDSDRNNLCMAVANGITGVMLPFVRDEADLQNLRRALKEAGAEQLTVLAKIENQEGIRRLPRLLPHADQIVIARGDLGNDMPLWDLPAAQYQIGRICLEARKPYMVVTQMLASMEHAQVPTRAEVSDIFYAILHGASAVMLTGETAAGEYPAEAMEYMCKTAASAAAWMAPVRRRWIAD